MDEQAYVQLIPFIDDFGATIVILVLVWSWLAVTKMQDKRSTARDERMFQSLDKLLTILGNCINDCDSD